MPKLDPNQFTLGQLITKLTSCDKDKEVWFGFEFAIPSGRIDSYRGFYEDLALGWTTLDRPESVSIKVKDLITILQGAVGKTFTGYKGGTYRMPLDTPLWVANSGHTGSTIITDVIESYIVVLQTKWIDV